MAGSSAGASLRKCLACRVTQCCCCSLRTGVLFLSILLFINACFAFAGEAVLYFDMAAAITSQVEGKFLEPGKKLASDGRVHGGLIFAGLYALFGAITGVYAVTRRSVRAATVFFALTVVDTFIALAISVIVWFAGGISFTALLTQAPGIAIDVYFVIVANSYRMQLKEAATGGMQDMSLPPSHMETEAAADGDDFAVTVSDVTVGERKPGRAAAKGPEIAIEDDDEDGDLGRGKARV